MGGRGMRAGAPVLVMLVLATAALAGCAGKSNESASSTRASGPAAPAEFGASDGGIAGSVVDEEQKPLAGAQVGIVDLTLTTTSDALGQFTFSHVAPGTHTLAAAALQYTSATSVVEVMAGAIAKPVLAMHKIETREPYSKVQIGRGLFGCGTSWRPFVAVSGVAACGLLSFGDLVGVDTSNFDRFLLEWVVPNSTAGGWNASVFEMKWDSNQAAGKGLSMIWEIDSCSNVGNALFASAAGRTPLRAEVDQKKIEKVVADAASLTTSDCAEKGDALCSPSACKLQSRVFSQPDTVGSTAPADVGVTFEQTFEQYHTSFYFGPAPKGFTALPS